jgi:Family of unknown function (DUF6428)
LLPAYATRQSHAQTRRPLSFPLLQTNLRTTPTTMTLAHFRTLLAQYPDHAFQLRLPDGESIPEAFHITEVARVQKSFIDCGGTFRSSETCQLQAWLGGDDDHRLATSKLAGILTKAESLLPQQDIPLEIEYEDVLVSQYSVTEATVSDSAVVLHLAFKHTDCLAKDRCGIPQPANAGAPAAQSCGCGPGCC